MTEITREEAIKRHRQMWSWIASETLSRGYPVSKQNAMDHFGWGHLVASCWMCELNGGVCADGTACALRWPGGRCAYQKGNRTGLYTRWLDARYRGSRGRIMAAILAKRISELPEKEEPNNAAL